ncbi:MAG: EH signature domain-containing protein, partial [Methylobacter sp.]|uniref:EH signature domain-containing protein n=1 Tax=Methylobacter sp. TaxID=2051955 RepID=UPI002590669A
MLKLPVIDFSLPEWEFKRDFTIYESVTESLQNMSRTTGCQSEAFLKSSRAIFSKAKEGKVSEIPGLIRKPLDARALTTLWLSELFFKVCPVTKELIEALYNPRPSLSKLAIQQLLRLFFQRFEQAGDLDALIDCLHKELNRNAGRLDKSSIGKLIGYKEKIISHDGPSWVAKLAIAEQTDLDIIIDKTGLKSFADTRFYSLCQNHYYLEQLRALEPGQSHPLLQEIIKPSIYESPYNQIEMLGHEVLRILIDRSPKEGVDEQWQGIILTIAGDPRIAKSAPKYQRWWTALNTQQIQKVRGWLSRFDLLLFLKVLEDYGQMNGKEDMNRMFPARKKFLEGLFDLGFVEDSRLFINKNAEYYLKRNYKINELPYYSIVADPSRSMIYLKIKGRHMIEGTHNFKLWLFEELPS